MPASAPSSSRMVGRQAPTALTCAPGFSHSPRTTGSAECRHGADDVGVRGPPPPRTRRRRRAATPPPALGALGASGRDPDLLELAGLQHRLEVRMRLMPGADDRQHAGVLAREGRVATPETAAVRIAVIGVAFITATHLRRSTPSYSVTVPWCGSRPAGGVVRDDGDRLQRVQRPSPPRNVGISPSRCFSPGGSTTGRSGRWNSPCAKRRRAPPPSPPCSPPCRGAARPPRAFEDQHHGRTSLLRRARPGESASDKRLADRLEMLRAARPDDDRAGRAECPGQRERRGADPARAAAPSSASSSA